MQADGLNCIRLVWFDAWEEGSGNSHVDMSNAANVAAQIAEIETVVDLASQYHIYVDINFHTPFAQGVDWTYATQFWGAVAPYFATRTNVIYEMADETSDGWGA